MKHVSDSAGHYARLTEEEVLSLYPKDFPESARLKVEIARDKASAKHTRYLAMQPTARFTKHQWDKCALWRYIFEVVGAFAKAACELGRRGIWPVYRIRTGVDEFFVDFAKEAYAERGRDRHGRSFLKLFSEDDYIFSKCNLEDSAFTEFRLFNQKFLESKESRQYEAERRAVARQQAEILKRGEAPAAAPAARGKKARPANLAKRGSGQSMRDRQGDATLLGDLDAVSFRTAVSSANTAQAPAGASVRRRKRKRSKPPSKPPAAGKKRGDAAIGARRRRRESVIKPMLEEKGLSINAWALNAKPNKVDFHTADNYLKGITNPYDATRKSLADGLGIDIKDLPK